MPTIWIENEPYEVEEGRNLLHAGLSLGFDIPYFCWHPALGSVGACRQCAVKQFQKEDDRNGRIVMACMVPAADGTRISISDPEARGFRRTVIEWLMMNHPHDCPICDEGGECHLQDMTVMTGHVYRRYRFKKRTFSNQYLGPFINHEMNRCITCYRCVRFYRDYAGGRDLDSFAAHDHVYFGRHEDGVLENEFSGNLVEVCPTGVFTDKTLKEHYTRKWDMTSSPSICAHCGLGCNTFACERYGELRRILNRYNSEVNGYFLCDRGRFGYEFANAKSRPRQPFLRAAGNGSLEPASTDAALERLRSLLGPQARVVGIGSPRASLEANYALRALVGPENFFAGFPRGQAVAFGRILDVLGRVRSASLHDVERSDAALVLGEDVTNTAPRLALALRQSIRQQPMKIPRSLGIAPWLDAAVREAVQNTRGPLFIATPSRTPLEDVATASHHAPPAEVARLGFAVAHALDRGLPEPAGLSDDVRSLAGRIAGALREAERPLVVAGTSCGRSATIEAAANVALALFRSHPESRVSFTVPEPNSLGLAMMTGAEMTGAEMTGAEMTGAEMTGAQKIGAEATAWGGLEDALEVARAGKIDVLVILENDLYLRADARQVDALLDAAASVVVLDHLVTPTAERADVVLPAGNVAETDGTFVNNEARAQRFFQTFVPTGEIRESWRWLGDVMALRGRGGNGEGTGRRGGWTSLDEVLAALAADLPVLEAAKDAAPGAGFRLAGQKIARQPQRYSGRTAMHADTAVHEPAPPGDPDAPLGFSMEGWQGPAPGGLNARYWAPGWNSVQSLNKFQSEVGGPLKGGEAGRRLIEPPGDKEPLRFDEIPEPFRRREDEWLLVPLHHIFGSEELSARAPAVAERAPAPYLALQPADAGALGLSAGEEVALSVNGTEWKLPLSLREELRPGTAGLPAGLRDLAGFPFGEWGRIAAAHRPAKGTEAAS